MLSSLNKVIIIIIIILIKLHSKQQSDLGLHHLSRDMRKLGFSNFHQVCHESACTASEIGYKLKMLGLISTGIVLSKSVAIIFGFAKDAVFS